MPPSAEQSFRSNLSQFRWARDVTTDSQHAQQLPPEGPFSRFYSSIGDYIPLRSNESSNEDEAWFALSRWERLLGFIGSLAGAIVCFFVAFLTLPILALKPAKFALAFSLGSLLVMFGCATSMPLACSFTFSDLTKDLPFSLVLSTTSSTSCRRIDFHFPSFISVV
ncbi:Protein transport protein sft2 [Leucoagaricus gongylophorus]